MHLVLLISCSSEIAVLALKHAVSSLQYCAILSEEDGEGLESVQINVCWVDEKYECVVGNDDGIWMSLKSANIDGLFSHLVPEQNQNGIGPDRKATSRLHLSEYIHAIADKLPYTGFILDVVLVEPSLSKQSCGTLGALMRLHEWHSAKVIVLSTHRQEDDVDMLQLLASVLSASVQDTDHRIQFSRSVWRGILTYGSERGFVLPGLSLECIYRKRLGEKLNSLHFWRKKAVKHEEQPTSSELVLGHRMELIALLQLDTVPLYLLDNFTLYLHLALDSRSSVLTESISESEVYLVRLPLYERSNLPTAAEQGLSTAMWKENISVTGKLTHDPEKGLLPCRQYLFLLLANNQESSDSSVCIARVIHSPTEISGRLFEELHRLAYFGFSRDSVDAQADAKEDNWLKTLPIFSAKTFNELDATLTKRLVQAIRSKKEESKENEKFAVTASELQQCILQSQKILLQHAVKPGMNTLDATEPSHYHSMNRKYQYLPKPNSDLDCDPSVWPERLSLSYRESKAKILRRFQSSESMALSSPPCPDESPVTSIGAKDLTKWFKADGTAACSELSPVRIMPSVQRLSSHEDTELQWPHCKDLKYHDVYYGHDKITEKMESFYKKFRDTILLEEYHNSFDEHPHIPALKIHRSHLQHNHKKEMCSSFDDSPFVSASKLSRRQHCDSQHGVRSGSSKLTPVTRSSSAFLSSLSSSSCGSRSKCRGVKSRDCVSIVQNLTESKNFSKSECPSSVSNQFRESPSQRDKTTSWSHTSHTPSSLPPLRRLSQPSGVISIFTSPLAQGLSRQMMPESPAGIQTHSLMHVETDFRRQSNESTASLGSISVNSGQGESRSQRHKRKLEETVKYVLVAAGVTRSDLIYKSCFTKLYQVTKFFVKQLPNSRNLREEMKSIAEKQVEQVVDLERRRQELAVKKKLRKSSIF